MQEIDPVAGKTPAADADATIMWPHADAIEPTVPYDPDATVAVVAGVPSGVRVPSSRTVAPIALQPGHRLHEYRIDGVLGQGGFGITYLATDVNLHTQVAIKEYLPAEFALRTGDSTVRPRSIDVMKILLDGLDQFLVEARTLATFRHPNIVRVARFFEANRTAYMVLDYERGRSLGGWWRTQRPTSPVRSGPPARKAEDDTPPDDVIAGIPELDLLMLLGPLLDGLALVHRTGVLHRDIKPDNLCVRDADGSLVLLDFGAACATTGADPDAPNALTPGYAPIEQYFGENQGPWTDLYALGATLYWMVAGKRPRDAAERRKAPEADVSAEQAGAGRYSPEFLRAIDWALQVRPEDRPQDVTAFRRALFSAHAASLGLQEALATSEAVEGGQGAQAGNGIPGRVRARLRRVLRSRVWRPPSWPLVVKMVAALALAAVLPMSITAYHNYTASEDALERAERRNIERLALATSGRLAQLIEDSRRMTAYVARSREVADLLAHPTTADAAAVLAHLQNLVDTNPDLHLLTLMDATGKALVSTAPEVVGGNYAFRDYFKTAMAGHFNVTSIIVGSVAGRAGVYVAFPVRDETEQVVGVIALRLRAEAIGAIVDTARNLNHEPFLVDGQGVLIHHHDEGLRFHSLATLTPQVQAAIAADQRFRLKHVDSLGMPELAAAMVGAQHEGTIDYPSTISKVREVAGYAPVSGVDWVVGVTESRASFEAPLRRIFEQALYSVAVVGAVFVLLAIVFARSISRPVKALTRAADALKSGDYDAAHVRVTSGDEIGALGRTFNVMIDVLRQRERERGMRQD